MTTYRERRERRAERLPAHRHGPVVDRCPGDDDNHHRSHHDNHDDHSRRRLHEHPARAVESVPLHPRPDDPGGARDDDDRQAQQEVGTAGLPDVTFRTATVRSAGSRTQLSWW